MKFPVFYKTVQKPNSEHFMMTIGSEHGMLSITVNKSSRGIKLFTGYDIASWHVEESERESPVLWSDDFWEHHYIQAITGKTATGTADILEIDNPGKSNEWDRKLSDLPDIPDWAIRTIAEKILYESDSEASSRLNMLCGYVTGVSSSKKNDETRMKRALKKANTPEAKQQRAQANATIAERDSLWGIF